MDDLERWKVLLYQYLLFKGDFYNQRAKDATERLQRSGRKLGSDEYVKIFSDLKTAEIFDKIFKDVCELLQL